MKRIVLSILTLAFLTLACVAPAWSVVPTPTPNALAVTFPTPKSTPNALVATVTAYEALHVRQQPSARAVVVGYLYNGNPVTLTGACDHGWAEIQWQNGTAWVNAGFLSSNKCSEEK